MIVCKYLTNLQLMESLCILHALSYSVNIGSRPVTCFSKKIQIDFSMVQNLATDFSPVSVIS